MMRSLWIAVAMYSKLPVPQVEWDRKSLSWALCFFPVVGVVIGLLLGLWLELCALLDIGPWLRAAGALLLPVAVSGAIHLDGFCDTADALGSHQPREKKLEILKDSHTGAFAIICCCLYLITFFAVWCEAEPAGGAFWVLCLGPALSRSLSGLAACSWPNARGSGLLATFTQPMDAKRALLSFLYYRVMSTRQFGGVTGDLAGFFLQICECAMVLQVVLAQRIEVLL